jgi:hypothetical protein
LKIILFFLLVVNLVAQDDYSFRVAYGKASSSTLGDILIGTINSHESDMRVLALDGGFLLKESAYEWPMDVYFKAGLSYFDESKAPIDRDNIYEATAYIKAYWNFDFLKNRVRLGLGEGLSYTSNILYVEYKEATENQDHNSYLLNYLDISLDFDFGRLVRQEKLNATYLGLALKHRSGIFGLINNVKKGGSNYVSFYIEKSF